VFFAIASQCISTLATLYREARSVKLPLQMFIGYGVLAYLMAFLVYRLFV
jgi:ferrous iron transport protein B